LAFLKARSFKFGLFETVCQNYNVSAFFGHFGMLTKIVYFKACSGEICAKLAIFFLITTLNLAIAKKIFEEILTFFIVEDFAFFEISYGQIWPFSFLGMWQTC
jgi:hypothetical protein